MKLTQKPSICITRLRKKSTVSLAKNQTQTIQISQSAINFSYNDNLKRTKNDNKSLQNSQILQQSRALQSINLNKVSHFPQQYQKSYEFIRSQQEFSKQNKYQQQQYLNKVKMLAQKIQELTTQNISLINKNQSIESILAMEENQKKILEGRICKLQNSVEQISQQLLLEKSSIIKPIINSFSMNSTPKQSLIVQHRNVISPNRRLSFHEEPRGMYLEEDLSKQVKQYKNQLEIEKLKRYNFQIELKNCKQNAKIEFRNQNQNLHRRIKHLQQTIASKDKQIIEKDGLINRCLIKKSSTPKVSLP